MIPNSLPGKTNRALIPQRPHDPAVLFGESAREHDCKAYPFFYNFTKYPYQTGIADPSTGIYSITGVSAEGPDGIDLPSLGRLDVPIVMDDDTNFHLLYAKYGAFQINELSSTTFDVNTVLQVSGRNLANDVRVRFTTLPATETTVNTTTVYFVTNSSATSFTIALTSGGASIVWTAASGLAVKFVIVDASQGTREYLLTTAAGAPAVAGDGMFNAARNTRIPYWTELDVSLYLMSSGARDLYGGFQREPIGGATEEAPIPILDLQGSQDGIGMVKTAFQLTRSALVLIRFTSRSAFPLRVYGHLFGYKITV